MLNTIRAIFKEGKIQLLEEIELPEGTEMLVTPLLDEADFWAKASNSITTGTATPVSACWPRHSSLRANPGGPRQASNGSPSGLRTPPGPLAAVGGNGYLALLPSDSETETDSRVAMNS